MKKEIFLKEKIHLIEQEIETLTEKLDSINAAIKELEDLKKDIKGLKVFMGRSHPDFKSKFPEIMQKIFKKAEI